MGIQYTDIVYQRDKYKKKYEEEKNKNASLVKEIDMMRSRYEDLNKEHDRLKRAAKHYEERLDTSSICKVMSTLGVNTDDIDTETLCRIMRGED